MFFADFSDIKTIIALLIAAAAVVFLLLSKKIAEAALRNKYDDKESEQYKEKLLNLTLTLKGIAAGIAVIACVLSLI
jgi:hypothetical protein